MSERTHGSASLVSAEEIDQRVAHAVAVERFLLRLGWTVLVLAVAGLVVTVVLWALGEISPEQAAGAIFGVVITSILSGATAYGSGVNIGLGASRLALAMRGEEERTAS